MEENYKNNVFIEMAVENYRKTLEQDHLLKLLQVIWKRMSESGEVPVHMIDVENTFMLPDEIYAGKVFTLDENVRLRMGTVSDEEGKGWLPLYTSSEEANKDDTFRITMNLPIQKVLEVGLWDENIRGVVINPFGKSFALTKELLSVILNCYEV